MNRNSAKRILVANDQEWAGRSIESILVANGYEIDRAYTGEQALRVAGLTGPDLIILDLQLPDFDGLEVCRLLCRDPATSGLPIIMLTAKATETDRIVGLELGADDYLGKPFEPNAIIKNDVEYILMLRKHGKYRNPTEEQRATSRLSKEEQAKWFRPIWTDVTGASTKDHPAPYPVERARRSSTARSARATENACRPRSAPA